MRHDPHNPERTPDILHYAGCSIRHCDPSVRGRNVMRQTYEEWRERQSDKWMWFQHHIAQEARRYGPNVIATAMVVESDLRLVYPLSDFEIRKGVKAQ